MYLNNHNLYIIIGIELMALWCRFESILLDSNNKYVFRQSSCVGVDYYWCRIGDTKVSIWDLYY